MPEVIVLGLRVSGWKLRRRVLLLMLNLGEDGAEWRLRLVRLDEKDIILLFSKGYDGVCIAMWCNSNVHLLLIHDLLQVLSVPFLSCRPVSCSFADYEGMVPGNKAHEFERRGFGVQLGDCGSVEVVIGCYEIWAGIREWIERESDISTERNI